MKTLLADKERAQLRAALLENAEEGGKGIKMNPKTTRFEGITDEPSEEEVISAIRSVPCHY